MQKDVKNFKDWINEKFIKWVADFNGKSALGFAEYLDEDYDLVFKWLKGDTEPSIDVVQKLAVKLGPDIFIVLGYLKSNEWAVMFASRVWGLIGNEYRIKFVEEGMKNYGLSEEIDE